MGETYTTWLLGSHWSGLPFLNGRLLFVTEEEYFFFFHSFFSLYFLNVCILKPELKKKINQDLLSQTSTWEINAWAKRAEINILFKNFHLIWLHTLVQSISFFSYRGKCTAPWSSQYFLTSKQEKKWQKKRQVTTKTECCFDSFSIYKKDDPFLHYLVMNENFCGVTLDVLSCVLTELVFLLSQHIRYSSISTVSTS